MATDELTRSQRRHVSRKAAKAYAAEAAELQRLASEVVPDVHSEEGPTAVDEPAILVSFQEPHASRYRDFLSGRTDVVSGILHATDTTVLARLGGRQPPCTAWAALSDHEGSTGRVGFSMHITRAKAKT